MTLRSAGALAAQAYLDGGYLPAATAHAATGADVLYGEELVDLYGLAPPAAQRALFPLIDPGHYRQLYGTAPGINLLADFLAAGPLARRRPHPLVDLGFTLYLRPDLQDVLARARGLMAVMGECGITLGPVLPLGAPVAEQLDLLRRPETLVPLCGWFDEAFYRRHHADVPPGAWAALRHFLAHGDAALRRPSVRFDPTAYVAAYAGPGRVIARPLYHYLSAGRFDGCLPLPRSEPDDTPVADGDREQDRGKDRLARFRTAAERLCPAPA